MISVLGMPMGSISISISIASSPWLLLFCHSRYYNLEQFQADGLKYRHVEVCTQIIALQRAYPLFQRGPKLQLVELSSKTLRLMLQNRLHQAIGEPQRKLRHCICSPRDFDTRIRGVFTNTVLYLWDDFSFDFATLQSPLFINHSKTGL